MKNEKYINTDWLVLPFIIGFGLYIIILVIGDLVLKSSIGKCKKALLTNTIVYHKGTQYLEYKLEIDSKIYKGDSNIKDLTKIGDSIDIVYLDWAPQIRRTKDFLNKENCNCN